MRPLAPLLALSIILTACTARTDTTRQATADRAAPIAIINGEETPAPPIPMGDPRVIRRVIDEGVNRNRVMDHLTYLSTDIGPRLTGSAALERANRWAMDRFSEWGLTGVDLHQWGEIPVRFDRGPSSGKVFLVTRKRGVEGEDEKVEFKPTRDMQLTTLAWAKGTDGPVRGHVLRLPTTEEEFESVKDKLSGAWVLVPPLRLSGPQGIRGSRGPLTERYERRAANRQKVAEGADPMSIPPDERIIFYGINGLVATSRDERVWTGSVPKWRELDPSGIPQDVEVQVRLSDYDYLNSRITDGEEFIAEFDLANTLTPGPIPVYNTVAEIRGSDKPDEYVIVSAHLDSWNGPGSMGTTDNGTGSAVTLEAARLLMAAGARPRRTIKFILWTGEEQGLLGARKWVADHEHLWPKISACFVDDGGTNSEGGLKCTDDMAPMLAAATAPVNGHFFDSVGGKPLNVNIQPKGDAFKQSGGSDHAAFIAKGIPGFFWDEVGRAEYGYGWHTQNDTLALAIPEYLRQSATCAAITAYNLACAEDMLPRFPLPEERPEQRRQGAAR